MNLSITDERIQAERAPVCPAVYGPCTNEFVRVWRVPLSPVCTCLNWQHHDFAIPLRTPRIQVRPLPQSSSNLGQVLVRSYDGTGFDKSQICHRFVINLTYKSNARRTQKYSNYQHQFFRIYA